MWAFHHVWKGRQTCVECDSEPEHHLSKIPLFYYLLGSAVSGYESQQIYFEFTGADHRWDYDNERVIIRRKRSKKHIRLKAYTSGSFKFNEIRVSSESYEYFLSFSRPFKTMVGPRGDECRIFVSRIDTTSAHSRSWNASRPWDHRRGPAAMWPRTADHCAGHTRTDTRSAHRRRSTSRRSWCWSIARWTSRRWVHRSVWPWRSAKESSGSAALLAEAVPSAVWNSPAVIHLAPCSTRWSWGWRRCSLRRRSTRVSRVAVRRWASSR